MIKSNKHIKVIGIALAFTCVCRGFGIAADIEAAIISAPYAINTPLSAPAAQYGRTQVEHVLADRPQLRSVVFPGSKIDQWLVHAFAAPELPYRLAWKNDINSKIGYSQSSTYPSGTKAAYIEVEGTTGVPPRQRTADEVMAGLVFELYNAHYGEERAQLDREAAFHQITRNDYISKFAETEFNAERSTFAFYEKVWKPFSQDHSLSNDLALWGNMSQTTFNDYLSKYPPTSWYPWGVYGNRFETYASFNGKETLSRAQAGNVEAEEQLGALYYGTRDFGDAAFWLLKAASAKNVKAEIILGLMYSHGQGLPLDENKALDWYLKAAQQGDPYSEAAAGTLYLDKAEYSNAFALFLKAAQQGNLQAEKDLALVYHRGEGVAVDEKQAFAWNLKAAQQGDEDSIREISNRYAKGVGVPADPIEAKRWADKLK